MYNFNGKQHQNFKYYAKNDSQTKMQSFRAKTKFPVLEQPKMGQKKGQNMTFSNK